MQLSRKQVILISIISGVVLLLTVAAILIFASEDEEAVPEQTPLPTETAGPTATQEPVPSPTPTAFHLPLVPLWNTPRPTTEPTAAVGAFVPGSSAPPGTSLPADTADPWVGAYNEHTKDIMAVGFQNGRATVLLLMRLDNNGLRVAALPANATGPAGQSLEETPLFGETLAAQGAQTVSLVERSTGMRYGAWLALNLDRLPAVLQVTGPIANQCVEALSGDGHQRAQGALSLLTGTVTYVQRLSLLQLPALRRVAGDAFESNLSTRELWGLFWTVRNGVSVRGLLLPTEGQRIDVSAIKKYFGESS